MNVCAQKGLKEAHSREIKSPLLTLTFIPNTTSFHNSHLTEKERKLLQESQCYRQMSSEKGLKYSAKEDSDFKIGYESTTSYVCKNNRGNLEVKYAKKPSGSNCT